MPKIINNLVQNVSESVAHYWLTRKAQKEKQKKGFENGNFLCRLSDRESYKP